MTPYVYVFVRTDIPLADQLVQVGHACLEAGNRFEQPEIASNMVLLRVGSEWELDRAVDEASRRGVLMTKFWEPDWNLGYTAACSEPVFGEQRNVFKKYELWTEHSVLGLTS